MLIFDKKCFLFYFMYLHWLLKNELFLQDLKKGSFIKIRPKLDRISNFLNGVFKNSFNQITFEKMVRKLVLKE